MRRPSLAKPGTGRGFALVSLLILCLSFSLSSGVKEFGLQAEGCTSILVGRLASADGSSMTSHSCDSNTDRTWMNIVPRQKHKPGEMASVWLEPKETKGPDDPDRIETGTLLVAAALAGDKGASVRVEKCNPSHLSAVTTKLEDVGAQITLGKDFVEVVPPETIRPVNVTTSIYSGFPTDMQAQWIALMSLSQGTSIVTETIYSDRFMHVPELIRLGADVTVKDNIATVVGVERLTGAKVMSTDLRASASLILAGLAAEGTTEVLRVYHLDRGYEQIEKKLSQLGADIERAGGEEF